ncbi:MAG: amidohydrolase family protein [Bacteroidales bacterium]|nr:amidohydrolase family protein [Bacteroidales bacterium]
MKTKLTLLVLAIMAFTSLQAQKAENILLKDYRPVSIFKVPVSNIERAAYPIIDAHTHAYAKNDAGIKEWIKAMDACGIEKSVILTETSGSDFDSVCKLYGKYSNRFEVWCGFDYTGYDKPGYGPAAVKELERCFKMGAKGVGEEGDKGLGMFFSDPVKAWGMHFDDPRMKPLFEKCAQLGMPISIHVADPIWMYEKMDSTNDGLMNAETWRIDMTKPGIIGFDALLQTLENAVKNNPKTTFIACHYANLNHDLAKLGVLFDKYPNFFADISARYAESAPVPRYMLAFFEKYQDRLLYGTDMSFDIPMYRTTFRILESKDEHFYETDLFGYHWALNGFGLPGNILKKIYHDNAARILK